MTFTATPISGAYLIEPEPFSDSRGWFARFYDREEFQKIGHYEEWVQINHSCTEQIGTIRGMHFQYPPFAEIKTVRCIAGMVYDVIVDLRKGSPTFLKWFGIELSPENKKTIYIPEGVAHGFQVIRGNAELLYCHTSVYSKENEGGLLYNDILIGIKWPLKERNMSAKDLQYLPLEASFEGIKL